jgi:hypothetical protein
MGGMQAVQRSILIPRPQIRSGHVQVTDEGRTRSGRAQQIRATGSQGYPAATRCIVVSISSPLRSSRSLADRAAADLNAGFRGHIQPRAADSEPWHRGDG